MFWVDDGKDKPFIERWGSKKTSLLRSLVSTAWLQHSSLLCPEDEQQFPTGTVNVTAVNLETSWLDWTFPPFLKPLLTNFSQHARCLNAFEKNCSVFMSLTLEDYDPKEMGVERITKEARVTGVKCEAEGIWSHFLLRSCQMSNKKPMNQRG